VPALNETELIALGARTLRFRRSDAPAPRLLVMIHGLKGDENSMWVFAGELPRDYLVVAPRAPYAVDGGGYSWRVIDAGERARPRLEDLRQSAEDLLRDLDSFAASQGLAASQFDVIGFSQGGTMVAVLTLLFPSRVRKAGILSGFLPRGAEALLEQGRLRDKPIFVAHGARDDTIPIEEARQAVKQLEAAGAAVTYCEDQVGHKVSAACLRGLRTFLED
jgi:phospholipase/carboxylesterase